MAEPGAVLAEGMGYRVVIGDAARDEARILALWRHGLSQNGKPGEKLRWYYDEHPHGPPRVFFLYHEGGSEPVGMAALATRVTRRGDTRLETGFLSDFVVTPEHRGFFPALMLQRAIRDTGLARHGVVFALPNPQSEAVTRRLRYRRIGDMVRYVRVVRSAALLQRVIGGTLATPVGALFDAALRTIARVVPRRGGARLTMVDAPDARFDDLWRRCASLPWMLGERGSRFLHWRFVRSPFGGHRFALLQDAQGALAGYAACCQVEDAFAVDDFLCDPGRPEALGELLDGLFAIASAQGASVVSIACLAPESIRRVLRSRRMLPREARPVVVGGDGPPAIGEWFVTPADEDA